MHKFVIIFMTAICFNIMLMPQATAADAVKIGVIQPFSGPTAFYGEEAKRGVEMALERINSMGGVLSKKLELIMEDGKGDPAVTISSAEKLIVRDKVVALMGIYSSTDALALLAAMKKYEPITIIQGGSAVKIDRMYGKERWLFLLLGRTPDYQRSISEFLNNIQPKPKRIAIIYEDTSFGVDQSKLAKEYLSKLGFELVAFEPFKGGALDHSALLTKIKGTSPDVLYVLAYVGDCILVTKQCKELGLSPKLLVGPTSIGMPEYNTSLKGDADYVCGLDAWIASARFPASSQYPQFFPKTDDWVNEFKRKFNREPNWYSSFNYLSLVALTIAINKAGSTEKEKVIGALESLDTMTPFGHLKFSKNEFGSIHQGFKDLIVFQWQKGEKVVVWPKVSSGGKYNIPCHHGISVKMRWKGEKSS